MICNDLDWTSFLLDTTNLAWALPLKRTTALSSVFIFAWPNNMRAVNRAKTLMVSVSMQLTNVCTGHHELFAGHLACVPCEAPHFGKSAKEIVLKFMVHSLFSWVGCPFKLIQNRTPLLIFILSLLFVLPAGICSRIIYYLSEGQMDC